MASLGKASSKRAGESGAEAYPYDATLRLESQRGLDRLRCFADRALATELFAIFQAAERNTEAAIVAQREQARRDEAECASLSTRAARALAGEFGAEPQELARRLLVDKKKQCSRDLRLLREFRRALVELKRVPR